ncbi:MAG: AAA family ATPase [Ilumatobacteraceae bacterium]
MESRELPLLIVVRGPSGSGKSTVARRLFERAVRRVCLIEQDHYRFIFRPAGGGSLPNSTTIHRMIEQNVISALTDGYDVILEGILSERSYGVVLDRVLSLGMSDNFLYSFDLSIEETLRRHRLRVTADCGFTEDDMRGWYPNAHPWGHELERSIPESSSIDDIVNRITEETQLLRRADGGASL